MQFILSGGLKINAMQCMQSRGVIEWDPLIYKTTEGATNTAPVQIRSFAFQNLNIVESREAGIWVEAAADWLKEEGRGERWAWMWSRNYDATVIPAFTSLFGGDMVNSQSALIKGMRTNCLPKCILIQHTTVWFVLDWERFILICLFLLFTLTRAIG